MTYLIIFTMETNSQTYKKKKCLFKIKQIQYYLFQLFVYFLITLNSALYFRFGRFWILISPSSMCLVIVTMGTNSQTYLNKNLLYSNKFNANNFTRFLIWLIILGSVPYFPFDRLWILMFLGGGVFDWLLPWKRTH